MHTQTQAEKLHLTEAARYLNITRQKLSRLVAEGAIPYSTSLIDKRVKLFDKSELDKAKEASNGTK